MEHIVKLKPLLSEECYILLDNISISHSIMQNCYFYLVMNQELNPSKKIHVSGVNPQELGHLKGPPKGYPAKELEKIF